jgi:hypothetical protein
MALREFLIRDIYNPGVILPLLIERVRLGVC